MVNLASYLVIDDQDAGARAYAGEAFSSLQNEQGHWLRSCLQLWALLGARAGLIREAAKLIGFVDAGYAASGEVRDRTQRPVYQALSERLAAALSADEIAALAAEGAQWSEREAVEFTRTRLIPPAPDAP